MENKKLMIIGLDLSLNSTGICIYKNNQKMNFYRVIYTDSKKPNPKNLQNINQIFYRMPTNIIVNEICPEVELDGFSSDREQLRITLKSMIAAKKINTILAKQIDEFKPTDLILVIENYIMPSFGGKNSLVSVSGNIALQTQIREFIIKYYLSIENLNLKIYTPTPTANKKVFTNNGNADKEKMQECFVNIYDGKKLIPELNGKVDDVIDAFSLTCYGYSKTYQK
jgi:Holliday junction resolvasome RuvABC endonuclease subunit